MLRNDRVHDIRMDSVHTRDLCRAVEQHHKNNPHVSMDSAFTYIMSNSSIFRALPSACIKKARSYLLLPKTAEDTWSTSTLLESLEIPLPLYHITCTVCDPQDEPPAKPKPGTTVVHAERVVVDNKKMIKILKFENVCAKSMLPNKYLSSFPRYYELHSGISIMEWVGKAAIQHNIFNGYTMSIKDFGKRIKTMKEAAARLSKINKTAKLEKEHSGKFTVSI